MRGKTVWSRNFTIITLGTLVSAIGGAGITLGLTLVVFDQTQSTWLSGIYGAVSLLPMLLLPVLFGPLVDRANRKHMVVGLDALSGLIYLLFMVYIWRTGFSYSAYLLFSLVTGSIGQVYSLAYMSLYPDMIPDGMEQKGYAVSGMVYPIASTVVTPIAAVLYERWGIEILFLIVGISLLIAALFESGIDYVHTSPEAQRNRGLRQYISDLMEGFEYLKKEKGVRQIYMYMMVTNATGQSSGNMAMAHFQTSSVLTTVMYGLLKSAETVGRFTGSLFHYALNIPEEKRYAFTVRVYAIYELCDGLMLFMAYPVMIVFRFLCGFLGTQTAAVRNAAVQKYLPAGLRARVNGVYFVFSAFGLMVTSMLAGALGEWLSYRLVAALLAGFGILCLGRLIVRNKKHVEPIYNHKV